MQLRITIDAFSGRENPAVIVDGPDAEKILERVQPAERVQAKEFAPVPESIIGYRGVLIVGWWVAPRPTRVWKAAIGVSRRLWRKTYSSR